MKCPYCGAQAKEDICPKCFAALKQPKKAEKKSDEPKEEPKKEEE